MINFNTKKKILKRLSDCAEKHVLLLLPCLIAAGFVKLFYFIACSADIALSDKEGNFLGIKKKRKAKAEKPKKQDDIVYVKRPVLARAVSFVLAAAFAGTFVVSEFPNITALAYSYQEPKNNLDEGKYTVFYEDDNTAYYYDENTDYTAKTPVINENKSILGATSVRIIWDSYTFADLKTINTLGKSDNMGFNSAKLFYQEYKNGSPVDDAQLAANINNIADITYKDITGLNADSSYAFWIEVYQTVWTYAVNPKERTLKDAVDAGEVVLGEKKKGFQSMTRTYTSNVLYRDTVDALESPQFDVTYTWGNTPSSTQAKIKVRKDSVSSDITGFIVYRSTNDGNYSIAKNGNSNAIFPTSYATSWTEEDGYYILYTDKNLALTTKYSYVVASYYGLYGDTTYDSGNSDKFNTSVLPSATNAFGKEKSIITDTADVTSLKAVNNETNITLSWNYVLGATKYQIDRIDQNSVKVTNTIKVEDDSLTSYEYVDTNVYNGAEYIYTVTAINENNENKPESDGVTTPTISINLTVSAPQSFSAIANDETVTFSWFCTDKNVSGFEIEWVLAADSEGNIMKTEDGTPILNDDYSVNTDVINATSADGKFIYPENISSNYQGIYDITTNMCTVNEYVGYNRYSYSSSMYTSGEIYLFRIKSYKQTLSGKDPLSGYVPAGMPKLVKIEDSNFYPPEEIYANPDDQQITVNWSAVADANLGYYLYIEKKVGNSWVNIYEQNNTDSSSSTSTTDQKKKNYVVITNGTSYVHSGLSNNDTYRYCVVAVKYLANSDQTIESKDSTNWVEATVGALVGRPKDITATLSTDGTSVVVDWSDVTDAEGYFVYIKQGNDTPDIKEVTNSTYTHTNVTYGATYTYYVYAYKNQPNSQYPYVSAKSTEVSVTVGGSISFPGGLTATPSDGQIALTWTAVTGAEGYIVTATSSDGTTENFNVTEPNFTHTGLTAGKVYTYSVKAYKTVNGTPVYSESSASVKATVGGTIAAPKDFAVSTDDASATLTWTAVTDAAGYTVYGYKDGESVEFDVSQSPYTHTGLTNGDTWHYYVKAYKLVNNQKVYSDATTTLSVKIGTSLMAPMDLVATSGNRQIDLAWTAVTGATGYIVYLYDESSASFQPLSVVSKNAYSHTSLKNGTKYTYMVAAYKMVNNERAVGDYSMAVSAIPSAGSASDVDTILNIKGTAPYGISHSELISAGANHEAFDDVVDAYISVNDESTRAVKEVLRNYANGLQSFIIYPFEIKTYLENTLVEVEPNSGYTITFTMPVPDVMTSYRDYITVIHLKDDGTDTLYDDDDDEIFTSSNASDFEVLPSALVQINDVWCIQFETTSCSPFAFVVYKDNLSDISGGAASSGGTFAGSFNTGVLLFTALPDIMPTEKKTKFVVSTKKYYRIKK